MAIPSMAEAASDSPKYAVALQRPPIKLSPVILTIGSALDSDEYIFGRVENVVRLTGATFVVADATSHSLAHYRPMVPVGIANATGRLLRLVGSFPGEERTRHERSDGPRALGQCLVITVDRHQVLVGTGVDFRFLVFASSGDSIGVLRGPFPPDRIQPAELRLYKDSLIRSAKPEFRASWARQLSEATFQLSTLRTRTH